MPRSATTTPELALPVPSLQALRGALEAEVGVDAAARALRQAGHAAGDALFPLLSAGPEGAPDGPGDLPEDTFWRRVADLFSARGWGRLQFEPLHPGLGALEAADWVEASPEDGRLYPSCHFTTGLLANLLGRAAGDRVGVLEVECRSRGDLHCRFLFGGQDALERVHGALARGQDIDRALAQLA
jgi:predicted hydrocarbon binding protein